MPSSYRITVTEAEYQAILSASIAHDVHYGRILPNTCVEEETRALDRVLAKLSRQRSRY